MTTCMHPLSALRLIGATWQGEVFAAVIVQCTQCSASVRLRRCSDDVELAPPPVFSVHVFEIPEDIIARAGGARADSLMPATMAADDLDCPSASGLERNLPSAPLEAR